MAKPKPKPKTKHPDKNNRASAEIPVVFNEPGKVADSVWAGVSSIKGVDPVPSYDEWAELQKVGEEAMGDAYHPTDPELIAMDNSILPNYRLSIYFASKLQHANIGKLLLAEWTEFQWTSRWPQCHVGKVPQQSNYSKVFWEHDLEDVQKANVVLVYSKSDDVLRGALVKAGMAIALGKRVVVVGENDSYGTWQYHPLVFQANNLAEARQLLRTLAL